MVSPRASFVAATAVVLALFAAPNPAVAGGKSPEKVFAGKVILSSKRFPTYSKSASAYISAIRKLSKTSFMEDKATGGWKIYFAAFLTKPLDDLEILVKLYDVTGRSKSVLATFEQFVDQRGQRTIISEFTLARDQVGVNKEIVIELDYKGRHMAAGQFRILGEAEKYSGKVDFSEDDTKSKDEEEE
jgi:hypothetical protein